MTLFRTVAPAVEPVTLSEVKTTLRLDHDGEDELIAGLIRAAREEVEASCGLALVDQDWRLALERPPRSGRVLLRRHPVREILSVTAYGSDGGASLVDPATYRLDGGGRPARLHFLAMPPSAANGIEIDYRAGHMSVAHKKRYVADYRAYCDYLTDRVGYPHVSFMDAAETGERVGSKRYFGGMRDMGTGHIHPLKLVVGTARVAAEAGARLHEETGVTGIEAEGGKVRIRTATGTVTADRALIATNAHGKDLDPVSAAHIMPIGSFIGATPPLGDASPVLPGGESVDDSRFVVRYFRRSADGRLLFGGREIYAAASPSDIRGAIRRQIAEVYPDLADVELTHAWGGYVGITMPRKPFMREVKPRVMSIGGFSGHGVMLANFAGKLYAESVSGNRDRLKLFEELKIPPFPGGARLRPLLLYLALNWYALRDRI